jgi:hypothetical protein
MKTVQPVQEYDVKVVAGRVIRTRIRKPSGVVLHAKRTAAQRRMTPEELEGDLYAMEQIAKAGVALAKGLEAVTVCRLCWEPAGEDGLCALHRTRGAKPEPVDTPAPAISKPTPKPKCLCGAPIDQTFILNGEAYWCGGTCHWSNEVRAALEDGAL